ncbi:MAG: DUF2905 domain-containing protein [Actinomycetota bacterium]
METSNIGRILLIIGVIALVAGGIFVLFGKLGLGSMPGDMQWGKGNVRVFFPLGTSIVLSIILTVLLNLFLRRR